MSRCWAKGKVSEMKVLHVYKVYLPDSFTGIEHVIWEIAEGTAAAGVKTTVFSLSQSPSLALEEIGQHQGFSAREDLFLASTSISFTGFGHFRALCQEADIIHYHFPWPMMDLLHFMTGVRKPSIVTYHSDVVKQKLILKAYAPLMHLFLSQMDAIVATSPNYVASSAVLQRHLKRVRTIPLGTKPPANNIQNADRIAHWRERVGQKFFLFLGAFRYYKGLPFLIEAARQTGLPVVIAGTGDPDLLGGPVPDNVVLTGKVDETDKYALLSACTAFVLPSHLRSEAFGIVLSEAAFAGKPMISCEIGTGTSYVNLNGETGLVVPPADPQALADAMHSLWIDDAAVARFGAAAYQRAETLFKADDMAKAYTALYREVL